MNRISFSGGVLALVLAAVGCVEGAIEEPADSLESELNTGCSQITLNSSSATGYAATPTDHLCQSTNPPASSSDGNMSTRASCDGINSYLTYNLGNSYALCGVDLAWHQGDMRTNTFKIQTSMDGTTFTDYGGTRTSAQNLTYQNYSITGVNARYVRILFLGNSEASNDWFSLSEIRVGGSVVTETKKTPTSSGVTGYAATPTNHLCESTNPTSNSVDSNLSTRASCDGINSWLRYDLGASYELTRVNIAWYEAATRTNDFKIQTSTDGTTFTDYGGVRTSTSATGFQQTAISGRRGRYVRILFLGNSIANNDLFSISEVDIYALASGTCTPTTCSAQGKNCGTISNGCSGTLNCGTCGSGQTCGVTTPNVCSATCNSANLLYNESFEGSSAWSGLHTQFPATSYAFQMSTAQKFAGSKSGRFELRDTDPMVSNGTRVEVVYDEVKSTSDLWYSYRSYYPGNGDYADDSNYDILAQWHQGGGTSPPMAFTARNGEFFMEWRAMISEPYKVDRLDVKMTRNVWHEWVWHINYSTNSSGLVEVWHREGSGSWSKVYTRTGQNIYARSGADFNRDPNWKVGIYKDDWNYCETTDTTKRVFWLDNVRMGNQNATFNDMAYCP